METTERRKRHKGEKRIYKEILPPNYPYLVKDTFQHISKYFPNMKVLKTFIIGHIINKVLKNQNKEFNDSHKDVYKGSLIRLTSETRHNSRDRGAICASLWVSANF